MTAPSGGNSVSTPRGRPIKPWIGCLLFLAAWLLPVSLVYYLTPGDRALDATVDLVGILGLTFVAGLASAVLWRFRKQAGLLAVLPIIVVDAGAALALWNYWALYFGDGNLAVRLFGWDFSARPLFYALLFLVPGTLAIAWRRMARRARQRDT